MKYKQNLWVKLSVSNYANSLSFRFTSSMVMNVILLTFLHLSLDFRLPRTRCKQLHKKEWLNLNLTRYVSLVDFSLGLRENKSLSFWKHGTFFGGYSGDWKCKLCKWMLFLWCFSPFFLFICFITFSRAFV